MFLMVRESMPDVVENSFSVEVCFDDASAFSNPPVFYQTTSDVDFNAAKLSLAIGDKAVVKVSANTILRAKYRNGVRELIDPEKNFRLSAEERQRCLFKDSRTAEMI